MTPPVRAGDSDVLLGLIDRLTHCTKDGHPERVPGCILDFKCYQISKCVWGGEGVIMDSVMNLSGSQKILENEFVDRWQNLRLMYSEKV